MGENEREGSYRGLSAIPMIYFQQLVLDRTMELSEWLEIAPSLGLDATEVHDQTLRSRERQYLETVAQQVREHGLEVSQVIGASDLTNPDPEARKAELQRTYRNIDAAAVLGATCLRMTAGQQHPGLSHAEGVELAVDGIKRALEYADGKGVLLAYEDHWKDYFWSRPDFSQRSAVFLQVLEGLRDTPIRVNFDCSNPVVAGEDPVALLAQVREYVVHVHCSDRLKWNEYPHAVTGEGVVDYPAIFRLLKEIGYDSWLSVEYGGAEGLEGLRRSISNVRRLWREA